jgi:hypothetical protein
MGSPDRHVQVGFGVAQPAALGDIANLTHLAHPCDEGVAGPHLMAEPPQLRWVQVRVAERGGVVEAITS